MDTTGRFVLHFTESETGLPETSDGDKGIDIYGHERKVYIRVQDPALINGNLNRIEIYNVLGAKVYQKQQRLEEGTNMLTPGLETGHYIVRLHSGEKVYNQRIFLE